MKETGIYEGTVYELPGGYELKEQGLVFDTKLGRYRWRPMPGDFMYYPDVGKIFKYIKWIGNPPGCLYTLDGLCKVREEGKKKAVVASNIDARTGIPLKKKEVKK